MAAKRAISVERMRCTALLVANLRPGEVNVIRHNLPVIPHRIKLAPSIAGLWSHGQPADEKNIYLRVAEGGARSGIVYLLY
ncbi:MAG: hypothetical protein WA817_24320 [Candidatus Acidiferrum sp.]